MATVHPATLEDIPAMAELLALLFMQEADFSPDLFKQQSGLKNIIQHPQIGNLFVLKEKDVVIGMVSLLYTVSTAMGGQVAILEDLVLKDDSRGQGAGTKLLKAAIDYAKEKGCLRITLLTDPTNRRAIEFYQRQGFIKSAMKPLRLIL
ncbi:MAG: GNAT family N-acetyltransferase [Cytophagaceae bacterium]|nr:GNAT family N-acetyltransferase [Cytophagaceae bacterium]